MSTTAPASPVRRVRHELKLRDAMVVDITRPTSGVVSVTLVGGDLRDFTSSGFDDHVKVIFPAPGELRPVLPVIGASAPAAGPRPVMRDFTPRRYDPAAGTLELDFVLHDDGPATTWARQAAVGQHLGIGGPKGSMVIDGDFAWHLLVGDATALPAIRRRLTELPESAAIAIVAAAPAYRLPIAQVRYVEEHELLATLRALALPPGEGFAWAAGEAELMKATRRVLVDELHLPRYLVRVSAYWKRGETDVHGAIEE